MAARRTSDLDTKEDLAYIVLNTESSSAWGGYRKELITQKLTLLEENLVVCSKCPGIIRDACIIKGGLAQVCEGCVGEETGSQPVGPIRASVAKLACRCPLVQKGCEWEGALGDMDYHLDECNQFIVQCPFVKYGCRKEFKRGELDKHRKDAKEYHTEVVSVFMAEKVEKLEEEKRQQTEVIEKLQSAMEKLQLEMGKFLQVEEYLKINGMTWIIENRHNLINKIYELQGQPQNAVAGAVVQNPVTYNGDATYSNWDGTNMDGPKFLIHSYYHFYPRLTFQYDPNATFDMVSHYIGYYDKNIIWPFQGKCTITLVNQEDENDSWVHEINDFQIIRGGTVNIADIPFDVLLDEKYNKGNTFVMKIFIKPHP